MKSTMITTMKSAVLALSLLPSSLAATIYLAGDSTMASNNGGIIDGWGNYITDSVTLPVANRAIGGRSARSYTREGRFDEIASLLQSGDYVVIEFGHNDGGSLSTDNGRTDCPGSGTETCQTTYDGVAETVLTFPAYLQNAAKTFQDLGANVLISSQTPNNVWEGGAYAYTPNRFVEYAQLAAENVGADYVDHGAYVAAIYESMGSDAVNALYPQDHTHTNAEGAGVVAEAFLKAVVCSGVAFGDVLATEDFEGECL